MKPIFYFLIIVICSALMYSCSCRSKADIDYYYYGVKLENKVQYDLPDDTLKPVNAIYNIYEHTLRAVGLKKEEDGGRVCPYKDLNVAVKERIDSNTFKIYCDHDLYIGSAVIPRLSNFTDYRELLKMKPENFRYANFHYSFTITLDSPEVNTPYKYYTSGTTSVGNSFLDSITVVYN